MRERSGLILKLRSNLLAVSTPRSGGVPRESDRLTERLPHVAGQDALGRARHRTAQQFLQEFQKQLHRRDLTGRGAQIKVNRIFSGLRRFSWGVDTRMTYLPLYSTRMKNLKFGHSSIAQTRAGGESSLHG